MLSATILILCFLIIYVYALYPGSLILIARWLPRAPAPASQDFFPSVSLIIPAYNEDAVVSEKMRNSLALDYPEDRLQIVVVSDGSTDRTAERARDVARPPAAVVEHRIRRGKTAVLNETIPTLTGEIVVQSDANSSLDVNALREIVKPFADPGCGCVVGQLVFSNREDPRVATGEGLYWSYENRLKEAESRLGGTITANGGLYAFRKTLFSPLPEHVAGDAADPLSIVSKGFRVIFAPAAIAREKAAESLVEEFARKVRIMTQGLAAWVYLWGMISHPRIAWQLLSHKLLRWLLPWALLALLILCLFPAAPPWAHVLGGLQIAFYALALIGLIGGRRIRTIRPVGAALYFCVANAAALVATVHYATGRRYALWEKSVSSR